MTKSQLIEVIAERARLPRTRAEDVVNCIFETMSAALERGEGIEIRGFGSFTIRDYEGYTGRNPKKNEPVAVKPKKLPFFKVGKDLKDLVASRAHLPLDTGDDRS
ncbi:MAG: HU family DNA-binding protein [Deltaproteobacteria bacterium]|nr:HU family DNA-binding protein [Deltaproteobacteria bacterium]